MFALVLVLLATSALVLPNIAEEALVITWGWGMSSKQKLCPTYGPTHGWKWKFIKTLSPDLFFRFLIEEEKQIKKFLVGENGDHFWSKGGLENLQASPASNGNLATIAQMPNRQ